MTNSNSNNDKLPEAIYKAVSDYESRRNKIIYFYVCILFAISASGAYILSQIWPSDKKDIQSDGIKMIVREKATGTDDLPADIYIRKNNAQKEVLVPMTGNNMSIDSVLKPMQYLYVFRMQETFRAQKDSMNRLILSIKKGEATNMDSALKRKLYLDNYCMDYDKKYKLNQIEFELLSQKINHLNYKYKIDSQVFDSDIQRLQSVIDSIKKSKYIVKTKKMKQQELIKVKELLTAYASKINLSYELRMDDEINLAGADLISKITDVKDGAMTIYAISSFPGAPSDTLCRPTVISLGKTYFFSGNYFIDNKYLKRQYEITPTYIQTNPFGFVIVGLNVRYSTINSGNR